MSRFWAVLLAVALLFCALPATGVSAAGGTDGVTVTATSNFFPTQTMHLTAQELAENDNKLTVTYFIQSDERMVNCQWVLTYSDNALDALAEDNGGGAASSIMPNATAGSLINFKPKGAARIIGSCSDIDGYFLNSESGGKIAFVSVTFRVVGTGEANVNLNLKDFSIAEGNASVSIVENSQRTNHAWNGEQSTDVRSDNGGETEAEGVTVTATSNFFPTQTVCLSAEELAEKDNKVTVTYYIQSDEQMVNNQWVVTYSDDVLDVLAEDNTDGTVSTIMPHAISGSFINIKPRGESQIVGNCTNIKGYPLQSESGGRIAFLTVTFRVIGTGEANVNLDLSEFSIAEGNKFAPIILSGIRTDHAWNGDQSADVYSGGYTETDSTLFVSLSVTNDVAGEQTVTLRFGTGKGIFGYYWGADADCLRNPFSQSGKIAEELVRSEGTYYAAAKDIDGKLSDTVSVTFVKTTLNANGGFVSPASVLTAKGNSFDLPVPTRSGYTYLGWAANSGASSGVRTLTPTVSRTYYAVWTRDDNEKPTVALSATNNLAGTQTVTLSMDDNAGIAGYYWGTSSSYRFNSFSVSGKEARIAVSTAGVYYVTALDTNGNLSDTQSVTFYKTILNASGGSVSPNAVLTQAGKSFDFPTPTRSGYKYIGWSSLPLDTEGDTSLQPDRSTTYYAVWQAEENTKPTVKLTTTNEVAARQTVILTMKDSDGIRGYYWGTNPDCTKNKYTDYTYNSAGENVTASGTYYAVAVDKKGSLSDTASVTFYQTRLNPNGGSVRLASVLTQAGKSVELPTPTREGCICLGWATAPDAAEGVKTLAPTADATYYALWRGTQRFDWGRDNWNFNNSKARGFFAYSTYRDQISPDYQKVLKKNLTPTAYDIVFTGTSNNKAWLDEEWHGACYGMSALTLLSKNGYLPYQAYKSSATCLHDLSYPKADKNICSLVNYYQMLQANDRIQQHYETMKDNTNDANIRTILSLLSQNETVLIGYHKDGWGGHSVLAYEYEVGSWTWNGISYQGRIKVCDPNNSIWDNEKYYIYLNKNTYYNTYDWAIPAYAYGNVKSVSGAVINYISADPGFVNTGGYLSGTTGSSAGNYIARINAYAIGDNRTVRKVEEENGSYVNVNNAPGDIVEDYSYVLSGESKGVLGYKLYDPDAAYRVSQTEAEPLNLTMRYANSYMTGYAQAGYSILFDPDGYVELKGENTDYEIGMTFDDSYPTDWFTMLVSGKASSASLRMAEEGYILTADNLQNVRLRANNTDVSASLLFSTDAKSVFIYEIDETTIGLKIDADNNGTYETELTQNLRKLGDINGDGKLNVRDLTALQRCLAEINTLSNDDRAAADINNDGKIDILDVTCLQRYLAEFVTVLGR